MRGSDDEIKGKALRIQGKLPSKMRLDAKLHAKQKLDLSLIFAF